MDGRSRRRGAKTPASKLDSMLDDGDDKRRVLHNVGSDADAPRRRSLAVVLRGPDEPRLIRTEWAPTLRRSSLLDLFHIPAGTKIVVLRRFSDGEELAVLGDADVINVDAEMEGLVIELRPASFASPDVGQLNATQEDSLDQSFAWRPKRGPGRPRKYAETSDGDVDYDDAEHKSPTPKRSRNSKIGGGKTTTSGALINCPYFRFGGWTSLACTTPKVPKPIRREVFLYESQFSLAECLQAFKDAELLTEECFIVNREWEPILENEHTKNVRFWRPKNMNNMVLRYLVTAAELAEKQAAMAFMEGLRERGLLGKEFLRTQAVEENFVNRQMAQARLYRHIKDLGEVLFTCPLACNGQPKDDRKLLFAPCCSRAVGCSVCVDAADWETRKEAWDDVGCPHCGGVSAEPRPSKHLNDALHIFRDIAKLITPEDAP